MNVEPARNSLVTINGDPNTWINDGRLAGHVSKDGGWISVDGERTEIPPGHGVMITEKGDGASVELYELDLAAFVLPKGDLWS